MRIAVDTNFLVSATQWDYSVSHKLLQKLIRNNEEIFTTKEILDEFLEVLKRDFLYNEEETKNILERVLQFLTLVNPNNKIDVIKEDIEKIIESIEKEKMREERPKYPEKLKRQESLQIKTRLF